jgi:anti-anti-sigma regulatory factor
MDWLLPMTPTMESIVGFELMLDRHVKELDASIVCAYRTDSFDRHTIVGALCVHPVDVGPAEEEAQFRFVAADDKTWQLGGEVDVAVVASFEAAIAPAATAGDCVVDVSRLDFIDVGSMRAVAAAGQDPGGSIELVGARPSVRRGWELAGFAEQAPDVQLVG